MASAPVARRRRKILDDLGEEEVFSIYLNEVRTVGELVQSLFKPHGGATKPGRADFYSWVHAEEGRWDRWQKVKKMKAEAIAESALTAALDADESNARSAKLQHEAQKWFASTLDRDTYGNGPQVQVNNLSLGDRWLEALKELDNPHEIVVKESEGQDVLQSPPTGDDE